MSQLMDYFAPPPPIYPFSDTPAKLKTPKSTKRRRAEGTQRPQSSQKRAKVTHSGDPTDDSAQGVENEQVLDSAKLQEQHNPDSTVGTSNSKRRRSQKPRQKKNTVEPAEDATQSPARQLLIDPEEANRRREHAHSLLRGVDIDPSKLTADQLETFANQAPDLQNESLEMLVKYGPERLRIVHPEGEPDPVPDPVTPVAASRKKRRPRLTNSTPGEGDTPNLFTPTGHTRKPRITRGACSQCRESKTKVSYL
jgi:hypothetical protein